MNNHDNARTPAPTVITTPAVILTGTPLLAVASMVAAAVSHRRRLGHPLNEVERSVAHALATAASATYEQSQRHKRQTHDPNKQEWLTTQELAKQSGYSVRTIQRNAHQWGGQKHGREWRFPPTLRDEIGEQL